jgi:threonine synthase
VRLLDLYNNDFDALSKDVVGYSVTDDETREAMRNVYANDKYVLDPHGAVGYLGLKKYLSENKSNASGVFLETAHPGKFQDVVEETLQQKIQLPEVLQKFMQGSKLSVNIGNGFDEFKEYLLNTL